MRAYKHKHTHTHTPVLMNVLKGLGVIDGKDTKESLSCPHVLVPHGAVLLLTCSIQDVQKTCLPVNHHLLPVGVLYRDTQTHQNPTHANFYQ